jgi:hypothetical protein
MVIQYKRELGLFSFSIQGSTIALNDRDCRDDKGFLVIIYSEVSTGILICPFVSAKTNFQFFFAY